MFKKGNWLRITGITFICTLVIAGLSNRLFLKLPNVETKFSFYLTMAVVGIIVGLITNLYIYKMYIYPLRQIHEGIEYIRIKSEPGEFITLAGLNDVVELGYSINKMLEELRCKQHELKESEKKYKYLSFYDTLTGLYNRSYFEYEMKRISRNPREILPLSIISIDIDGHKIVNDTFGHQAGDKQLKFVAELLQTSIRKEDTLVRAGGDEFVILLPNVANAVAQQRKSDILEAIENHNGKNPFIPLSVSVGVATSDQDNKDETVYDIYHRADDDMYYQKFNKDVHIKGRVIDFFLSALSERDYISQGHADRMAFLAEKMATSLDMGDREKEDLVLLAKLHDLGNIGIPDEILFKPEELTQEERNRVRTHVNIGYNIASRSGEVSHIAGLILHHHEWWNGTGYPAKLKGKDIPIECRIISILDAYDTMTNPRYYNIPKTKEDALRELVRCSDTQFQPELVKAFLEVIENEVLLEVAR
jgi:diguanylate cyclase (GGDEF)-like protein